MKPYNPSRFCLPNGPALKVAVLPFVLLAMAACDSDAGSGTETAKASSGAKVAVTVQDDPCSLLTPQTVSKTFSVPVDDISQMTVSTTCGYDWETKSDRMDVMFNVSKADKDAAKVGEFFKLATRNMSQQEVADAYQKISAEAAARGQKTDTTERVVAAGSARDIRFEDVAGLGDQARFDLRTGRMHVLYGNLYFDVAAYHGPKMPTPAAFDMETIGKASETWTQETMAERKAAAETIARAVIAGL